MAYEPTRITQKVSNQQTAQQPYVIPELEKTSAPAAPPARSKKIWIVAAACIAILALGFVASSSYQNPNKSLAIKIADAQQKAASWPDLESRLKQASIDGVDDNDVMAFRNDLMALCPLNVKYDIPFKQSESVGDTLIQKFKESNNGPNTLADLKRMSTLAESMMGHWKAVHERYFK